MRQLLERDFARDVSGHGFNRAAKVHKNLRGFSCWFQAIAIFALLSAALLSAQQPKPVPVPSGVLDALNTGDSEYKADQLQAYAVDLNNDGTPEIAVVGRPHTDLCSGSGNCRFWIFRSTRDGYAELVSHHRVHDGDIFDSTVSDWKVLPTASHGYHDLQFFFRDLPWRATATRYRMSASGKYEYISSSCATVTYGYFEGDKFHEFKPPKSQPCGRKSAR